jgi:prepilin peptidase CpaA
MLERLPWITQFLLAAVVMIAGYYDIRWRRIPNWLTLPTLLVGLLLNLFLFGLPGLRNSFLGMVLAMAINFPLYALRARGAGDVKLLAAVGALVGWRDWVAVFVLAGLLGGVLALALMLGKGRVRKTFWNTGYIVTELAHFRPPHLRSEELDVTSSLSFRLPQGAVIALGCFAFLGAQALLH